MSKKVIPISIDKQLNDLMCEMFGNKSRYVEYLIHQDLLIKLKESKKLKEMIL